MSFYMNFLACSEVELWCEISLSSVDVQITTQPITYPHFTVNISVLFTYVVPLLPELQLFEETHLDCLLFVQSYDTTKHYAVSTSSVMNSVQAKAKMLTGGRDLRVRRLSCPQILLPIVQFVPHRALRQCDKERPMSRCRVEVQCWWRPQFLEKPPMFSPFLRKSAWLKRKDQSIVVYCILMSCLRAVSVIVSTRVS